MAEKLFMIIQRMLIRQILWCICTAIVKTPPVLIMHGGSDPLVPFNQSCILYEALKRMDKEVEFVKLRNAGHGWGGFMSEAALDIVEEFIKKKIN